MRGTSMVPFVAVAALGAALLTGAPALAGQTVPESDGPAPTLTLDDALGCAVLHEPPILFLDEPTSRGTRSRAGASGI